MSALTESHAYRCSQGTLQTRTDHGEIPHAFRRRGSRDEAVSDTETVSLNLKWIWTVSLVAALGGLLFGYDWVVIGGAKPFYEKYFHLTTPFQVGWAMSSA